MVESPSPSRSTSRSAALRTLAARLVQIVCTVIAVIIALAAVAVAFRGNVNADNVLVELVTSIANALDGPLSRSDGIFDFDGTSAETRNALVNWGLAAVVWFAIGRVAAAVIRR